MVLALKSLLFIPAFLRNDDEDNDDEDGNADDVDDKNDEDANVFLLSIESISGDDSLVNDDVDPIFVGFDKTKIKHTTGKISKLCYTKEQQMARTKEKRQLFAREYSLFNIIPSNDDSLSSSLSLFLMNFSSRESSQGHRC